VLRQKHQTFEIGIIEALTRGAVTKEKPADDTSACMQWDDDFGAKSIERTFHQTALCLIGCLREVASANEMRVQLKPSDQRISLAIFDLGGFRKTMQPGPKPISVTLSDLGKNTDSADTGGIGHALDDADEQRLDVVKAAKDPWKTQERHRWLTPVGHRLDAPRLRECGCDGLLAQFAILLQYAQVLESA
jgi:hypothetical protein